MANYIHQVQTADGTVFDLEAGQVLPNVNIKTINNTTVVGSGNISLPTFGAIASATAGLASNAAVAAATSQLATTAAVVSATSDLATNSAVANATTAMATTGYVDEQIAVATSSLISSPFQKEEHGAITRIDTVNTITIATNTQTPTIIGHNNTVGPSSAYWGFVVGSKHAVASNKATNYVFVAGYSNQVTGLDAFVVGVNNKNSGSYGAIVGQSNTNDYQGGFVAGISNTVGASAQAVVGKFNSASSTALFVVGAGRNNSNRTNAFEATPTGIWAPNILAQDMITSQLTAGSTGQTLISNENKLQWAKGVIDLNQSGYLPFGARQMRDMINYNLQPVFKYQDWTEYFTRFISTEIQVEENEYPNCYIILQNTQYDSPKYCKFFLDWQASYNDSEDFLGYAYHFVNYQSGEDHFVQQGDVATSSDYRILLSHSANDTTEIAETQKSSNLTFNPSTNTLHIGVGAASSATIELVNGAGSLSNEVLHGTDTIILQSLAGDLALQGDYVYINDYYGNTILLSDEGINLGSFNLMVNRQPLIPTITLYFGQGGLYKDAARTTLYTTADFANDIMDKDPQLYIDGGGDSSRYPATYYYEKNGDALDTARITCLVNEANTLYTAAGVYSTGTEGFVISSQTINKIPTGGTAGQVLTKIGSSDYAVSWVTPSGGGSAPITGITNPTTSTQGELGQMYLNTTTELMYVCTYATSGTYHWKPITFESAESQVG